MKAPRTVPAGAMLALLVAPIADVATGSARAGLLIDSFSEPNSSFDDNLGAITLTPDDGVLFPLTSSFLLPASAGFSGDLFDFRSLGGAFAGAISDPRGGTYSFGGEAGGDATTSLSGGMLTIDIAQAVTGVASASSAITLAYTLGDGELSLRASSDAQDPDDPMTSVETSIGVPLDRGAAADLSGQRGILVELGLLDPANVGGTAFVTLVDGDGDVATISREITRSGAQELFFPFADAMAAGMGTGLAFNIDDSFPALDGTGPLDLSRVFGLGVTIETEDGSGPLKFNEIRTVAVPEPSTLVAGLLGVAAAAGWWLRRHAASR